MLRSVNQRDSQDNHFCDATIRVQGVDFHVHKIIFSRLSFYFQALFIRHSVPNKRIFEIPGLSADMMQCITEFAYKGSVSVTEDNVEQLLQAADQFNVAGIVEVCCNFLEEKLCTESCIHIWQFTNTCFCPELKHKALNYVLDHFEEVISSEQFQQLSVQEFTDILGSDKLNVRQESTVYEAILKWIAYAPEERERHFAVLFSNVRLALTSEQYIEEVKCSALVSSNQECMDIVTEASQLQCRYAIRPQMSQNCSNPIARPRIPNAFIFVFGDSGETDDAEVYNIRCNSWVKVTDYQVDPYHHHGAVFYNGSIYCVGGNEEWEPTSSVVRFDLKTHTWHEVAPMHHRRSFVTVTLLNGYIYAIGGEERGAEMRRLASVERYNPETNEWTFVASMHGNRSQAGCAVLHNRIYVCGGYDGMDRLDTCEYYSPETNQWTEFTAMDTQRSEHGVIAYQDKIFALGGYDGLSHLRSVEAYNPLTDTWHAKSSMLEIHSSFGTAVIDDKLFAVGGYNSDVPTKCVECYDPNTDQWSKASKMKIERSCLSCVVVSGLPNIKEYVICRDTPPRL